VYETLLFFHVLAAVALVATVVIFSAFALGASPQERVIAVGNALWTIGGLGTIVFGVWLALYVQGYEIWDGWIITAIVLWAIATELGRRAQVGYLALAAGEGGSGGAEVRQAAAMHWLRSVVVLALLVVMIYKPGA
jgi:hypothetical protein